MKTSFILIMLTFSLTLNASINFIRIPKTGSTTVISLLNKYFAKHEIYPNPKPVENQDPIALSLSPIFYYPKAFSTLEEPHFIECVNIAKNLTTHQTKSRAYKALETFPQIDHQAVFKHLPMWFFIHKDPNFGTSFFFTVLRDPIDRLLSQYRYKKKIGTDQYIDSPLDLHTNQICKMLSSEPCLEGTALLKDSLRNLDRMDHIIFLDDFENGVKELFAKLNLPIPEAIPHLNTTKNEPVDEKLIRKLKKKHDLDIKFYKHAKIKYGK